LLLTGRELKSEARRLIISNAPRVFLIGIVYLLFITIISELQYRLSGMELYFEQFYERLLAGELPTPKMLVSGLRMPGIALALLIMLFQPVIKTGYMSYCLKLTRNDAADFRSLLDGFMFFIKVIAISVINSLLVWIGAILFIFPGVIVHYMYRQAYYILLDNPNKGVIHCLRESRQLMRRNKLDLFLIDISFLGWVIIDMIVVIMLPLPFSFPIIQIWLAPFSGLTYAQYYNHLIGRLAV